MRDWEHRGDIKDYRKGVLQALKTILLAEQKIFERLMLKDEEMNLLRTTFNKSTISEDDFCSIDVVINEIDETIVYARAGDEELMKEVAEALKIKLKRLSGAELAVLFNYLDRL